MNWEIQYEPEARKDFLRLAGNQRKIVAKIMDRVSMNPVSIFEGGHGKPLGNKDGMNLTGCYKIKIRSEGIRVVYRLMRTETTMSIAVIGMRDDSEVYRTAWERIQKSQAKGADQ